MRAKILLFISILIIISALFVSCTKTIPAVEIEVQNVSNVKEGDYTLLYSIKNYDRLVADFETRLVVKCFDDDENQCSVKNNRTITVEIDKIYTIFISVTLIDGENSRETQKEYTVTAVKTQPALAFVLAGDVNDPDYAPVFSEQTHMEKPLAYGARFNLDELPDIPDYYTHVTDGTDVEILSKKWAVRKGNEYVAITQSDLENITKKLYIFGIYTYKRTEIPLSIKFNSNGGTPIDTLTGKKHSMLFQPAARPVLDGYVFDKWYIDGELTTSFNWTSAEFTMSMTLHAGYVEDIENPSDAALFNFTKETDYRGNIYYAVSPKNKAELPADLIIPAGKDNIPVARINQSAFASSNIETVTIPSGITIMDMSAFASCAKLSAVIFADTCKLSYIHDNVFKDCVSLVSVNMPGSITQIGLNAFMNCAFSTIVLPESLTRINESAFFGCNNLISIEIPDPVATIGALAFGGCESLETVLINKESALNQIANNAFNNTQITEITLPFGFSTISPPPLNGTGIAVHYHEEVAKED